MSSARDGHAAAPLATVDRFAIVLGETTPHAVGLAYSQGMFTALPEHRALGADRFGGGVPVPPGRASLTFGVKEQRGICLAA
jgi:hypothetical protein